MEISLYVAEKICHVICYFSNPSKSSKVHGKIKKGEDLDPYIRDFTKV